MTYVFKDYHRNGVRLSFHHEPFSKTPKHVWVICRYQNKWLLTHHMTRGLEFPGGKVEMGEAAREAAIREVMEETGGAIKNLDYIGQYFVDGKRDSVIKNVYFATIDKLIKRDNYLETYGPVLLDELPDDIKENSAFSFMMKDDVLVHCLALLAKSGIKNCPTN